MNRVDRLHAILVHLQSKRRVTAQELADRFDLSLRTVYRDVKALEESGIPIIGESGIGYSIMEGYRLPPVMFSQEEASALLLGHKLVTRFTDREMRKHFESAMYKIKAVLRTTDKEHVEELDQRIAIQRPMNYVEETFEVNLTLLRQAIVQKKVVNLHYKAAYKDEFTQRNVEPVGLIFYGETWHLIAWCRLRDDYRDFRLDRIQKLNSIEESFDPSTHPSLEVYLSELKKEKQMTEVVISFDREVARFLGSQRYYYGYVSEEEIDGRVHMKFLSAHPESLARWILMFTKSARVETPSEFISFMEKLTEELIQYYKGERVIDQS